MKLTRQQREALYRLYTRQSEMYLTYRQFRKRVVPEPASYGTIMIHWCGMWLGIEEDGYTHS